MKRFAAATIVPGIVLLFAGARSASPQGESDVREQTFQAEVRPLVQQYCVACHNSRMKVAGVALDNLSTSASLETSGAVW